MQSQGLNTWDAGDRQTGLHAGNAAPAGPEQFGVQATGRVAFLHSASKHCLPSATFDMEGLTTCIGSLTTLMYTQALPYSGFTFLCMEKVMLSS